VPFYHHSYLVLLPLQNDAFLVALATAAFGLFTDRSADLLKTTLVTRREHDLKTSLAEGWYRFQLDFAAQQYLHARELAV
jgi:hypothetical protein